MSVTGPILFYYHDFSKNEQKKKKKTFATHRSILTRNILVIGTKIFIFI